MKLRLRENSIRFRLLQSEVKKLAEIGFVEENIRFSNSQKITYRVGISKEAKHICARFENDSIIVAIPERAARNWIETNLIGLEYEQEATDSTNLKITIEKDFVCLERPKDADNADAFAHPKMNC